jgi:hypothetical protein
VKNSIFSKNVIFWGAFLDQIAFFSQKPLVSS